MGSSSSSPMGNPSRSPFLEEPWLHLDWENRESDLEFINNYKPKGEGQEKFRILLHGLIGAGKSSFISSVFTALKGRISHLAPANNQRNSSFTKKYKTYSIKNGNPVVINDMMGLMKNSRRRRKVHVKDVKKAMKGRIKDGYIFNPESSLSKKDPFYNQNPTNNDKVHILVSVIEANKINQLDQAVVENIQDIRDEATELGIPHVVVLTKIDKVCPDINNVCRSSLLKKMVEDISNKVEIPENYIFPVKNYHCERAIDHGIDALILNTLRHIIEIGDEKLGR